MLVSPVSLRETHLSDLAGDARHRILRHLACLEIDPRFRHIRHLWFQLYHHFLCPDYGHQSCLYMYASSALHDWISTHKPFVHSRSYCVAAVLLLPPRDTDFEIPCCCADRYGGKRRALRRQRPRASHHISVVVEWTVPCSRSYDAARGEYV